MHLYIANGTNQVQDFIYRLPETTSPRQQMIPIGGQIKIAGDLNKPQIDAIVEQHAIYGLVAAEDIDLTVDSAGKRTMVNLCYSVGKEVNIAKIIRMIENNKGVQTERGKQHRIEAAVALNTALEDQMPGQSALNKLDISVVEERRDQTDESPVISEGISVTRTAAPPPAAKTNRNRRPRN